MDQLINTLTQKTGLSEDKAHVAVETVVNFLKARLPGPVGEQLDNVVSGGESGSGITGRHGSILGKKSA